MHAYLQESEYAVRGLFDLIGTEQIQCEDKLVEIQVKTLEYRRAKNILNAGAPMSGFGENTTPYFEKKARTARRQVRLLEFEVASLKASVETKEFSISSIAGAILQIAKQGMSIVHGSGLRYLCHHWLRSASQLGCSAHCGTAWWVVWRPGARSSGVGPHVIMYQSSQVKDFDRPI